jgi:hypothetical protein
MLQLNIREFAKATLSTFDQIFTSNFDLKNSLDCLSSEIEDERLSLNRPETVSIRLNHYRNFFPDACPADFQEKKLTTSNKFLAGIRFIGGDAKEPFIDVLPSWEITTESEILEIMDLIKREFRVFEPKYLQLWVEPSFEKLPFTTIPFRVARRVICGFIDELQKPAESSNPHIQLSLIDDDNYYDWYQGVYADFHRKNHNLLNWVPCNSKEEMDESRLQKLLFWIDINGERAGTIGGCKSTFLGVNAIYMNEILLTDSFRGKGFASQVQRIYLASLTDRFDLVWGTIDAKNIPSTKTALRVGRKIIRSEIFIPLTGI